jgi:hypothetical protein
MKGAADNAKTWRSDLLIALGHANRDESVAPTNAGLPFGARE